MIRTKCPKCRICSSVVECLHCVSLFSPEMTKYNLAFRMSRLLEVPKISQEDPLPHYACHSCKVKFISMQKFISMESKLESLRTLAKSSYQSLASSYPEQQPSTNKKRTKDTSGDDVSPSTANARPASKRGVGRSKTLFPSESCKRILDQNINFTDTITLSCS